MKYLKRTFICIGIFSFFSCNTGIQKELDLIKVEELATLIQHDFDVNGAGKIEDKFDPVLFSWRLGDDFKYKFDKYDRQVMYAGFRGIFNEIIDATMLQKLNQDLKVALFDIHELNGVYRLNFVVTTAEDIVTNYLVFYVDKNNDGAYRIVNIYDVFSGFTLGQTLKEYTMSNKITQSQNELIRLQNAAGKRQNAVEAASFGEFQIAYDYMSSIDSKYLNSSGFAKHKLGFASHLSDSIYKENLQWMKDLSKNPLSDKFYDCIMISLDEKEEETASCIDELEGMILEL